MKNILILAIIFISACTSNRVLINPEISNGQTISYVRGNSKLHSQSLLKSEFSILDYSYNEMIISLTVNNTGTESIIFSEENISAERLSSENAIQSATIYSYDQIVKQIGESGGNTLGQVGGTAAGIGASFIPFGGIAYSVGRMIYSIGTSSEGHQKRIDNISSLQLNQLYFRKQTVEPEGSYSGILKIAFEDDLSTGDKIIFSITSHLGVEKFNYICLKEGQKE